MLFADQFGVKLWQYCLKSRNLSVLPVFLLTALFKVGTPSSNAIWNKVLSLPTALLVIGVPTLVLIAVRNLTKNFAVTDAVRGVLNEAISFHLWTKNDQGKRIKLAITTFIFLLYVSPVPFITANPVATTQWARETNSTEYKEWESELSHRLWIASISSLVNGGIVFVLGISLILFEDQWVVSIVSMFPNLSKRRDDEDEEGGVTVGTDVNQRNDSDAAYKDTETNTSDRIGDGTLVEISK